jgi:archaeosine synthase
MTEEKIKILDVEHREGGRSGTIKIGNDVHFIPFMIDVRDKTLSCISQRNVVPVILEQRYPELYESIKKLTTENILETIGGLRIIENNPSLLVNTLTSKISKFSKIYYAPAIATPENLSILVYTGVDVVDNIIPIIEGFRGNYLTQEGIFPFNSLKRFPCECRVCNSNTVDEVRSLSHEEKFKLLAEHNTLKLNEELRKVKFLLERGVLRNYVEKQCKNNPYLTAYIRYADQKFEYFEERIPVFKKSMIYPNSRESYNRPEIIRFFNRVEEIYQGDEAVLLLPCSAKKPYMLSRTHRKIREWIGYRNIKEIIISSPLVVPREMELIYPAAHYDTPVTGQWDREEIAYVGHHLKRLLEKGNFKQVIAHLDEGYLKAIQEIEPQIGVEVIYTSKGNILDRNSLANLKSTMDTLNIENNHTLFKDMLTAFIDYQFGKISNKVITGRVTWKGRYPRLTFFDESSQIGVINPETGSLTISLVFAKRLLELHTYYVEIDEFIPKGNIFSVGVVDVDRRIRSGDEVVFYNSQCFGVGKAVMSGREMLEMDSGMAIRVRHVSLYSH